MNSEESRLINSYERLNTLYGISQYLSDFKSIEETIPKIFNCVEKTFPLLTAVLIENCEDNPKTIVWHSTKVSHQTILMASENAKNIFGYLAGNNETIVSSASHNNYIILPIVFDEATIAGALQLEGNTLLNEKDLEFANSLVNLLSVPLERFFRNKNELIKAHANQKALKESMEKIQFLESQQVLHEEFVAYMTHDLRSPLTVMMGSAQIIRHSLSDYTVCEKLATNIIKQADRINRMTNDILDTRRVNNGKSITIHKETVNISELMEGIVADLKVAYKNPFVFQHSGCIEASVDLNGFRRIIENLCSNAVKYGTPEGPITIDLKETNHQLIVSVKNLGDTISTQDLPLIFQPFWRSDKARKGHSRGWGIGLTVVQGIVEAHDGSVSVSSENAVGNTFIVTLPKI